METYKIINMFLILFYYSFFFVVFICTQNKTATNTKVYDSQFWICFIALFIFWGFRDLPILNDTNHYYQAQLYLLNDPQFEKCKLFFLDPDSIWQPGFQIIQWLIGKIWNNPYAIILFSALSVIFSTLWFTKKYTNQVALVVFFMLTFGVLNGQISAIRQGWAMCIFYVACNYMEKNKKVIVILLILLAMQFHSSAYVLFLLYGISFLPVSKRNILIVMFGGIIFLYLLSPIMQMLDYGDSKYIVSAAERESAAVGAILIVLLQILLLGVLYKQNKKYNIPVPNSIIVWGIVLSLIFNLAAIPIQVFGRFSVYFGIFQILYLAHCLKYMPRSTKHAILSFFVIISLARTGVILEYRNEWSHLVPYSFIDFSLGIQYKDFGY